MANEGYALTERDRAEMNRIRRKVDSIRGPGVVNTPDAISINAPPSNGRRSPQSNVTLPTGQYQNQIVLYMVSQNQTGASFARAHALI